MAANQPPPHAMDPDEERKLQLFLERAAPIVLESRVLDTENWRRLVALARELELTDGQLRATVEDLRRRGVIERIELQPVKAVTTATAATGSPAPTASKTTTSSKTTTKPPPLPPRPTAAKPVANDTGPSDRDVAGGIPPVREKTFSLNSPGPRQPPPPPPPPSSTTPAPAAPSPPPSRPDRVPTEPGALVSLREQLSRRAVAIIAEQRGFSPKTHSLIASAAEDLGLSERDVATVIRTLHQGDGPTKEAAADDANQRQRWKEEGKPEPPRHEAPKKPHEIFSAFVAKSLEKLAVGHVSGDLEEGLVAHGTKVLKLSRVYATQLVRDVAQQKDLLLQSDTRSRQQADELATQVDPRLRTFLDRAAPILAQHRGLNARSRVLLGAMAEEVGLAQSEVDAAVALLESKPAETDGLDETQRKRLAPFRQFAGEMLGQLPQKILTARVHAMMLERGDERFGIDADRARAVLRELASEQQIQIISEEEALRHITGLVDERLGDALRLEGDVKQRILQEGGQWGLSAEQIEQIIKSRSRENYKKRQSERNLSNAALIAALVAVLLVVGFLGWAMLGGRMTPEEPDPIPPPDAVTNPGAPVDDTDDSWWSVDLVLAVHNATSEFPLLRRTLKAIGSPHPDHRAAAYDGVIAHALNQTDDAVQRKMLLSVITQAYVVEPDEATADGIRQGLLAVVPGPEDRLSERADDYPKIFWAMRGAVAALDAAADNARRADDMARSIGLVVGTTIDRNQPPLQLERQCLGALAERLFRLMITSAASRPAGTVPLHRVIAEEAGHYLDRPRLETLNADFLAAVLPASEDSWSDFKALIDETMRNRDPLIVAKLIDVYETTTNAALRSHLQSGLLRRTNVKPVAKEARGIASEMRQSLGITEVVTAQGRTLDFQQLAQRELARTSANTDERIRAAELATSLSHVATLGCALAQGELGFALFDELIKKEPAALTASAAGGAPLFPTDVGTDWDALERIDSALSRLPREGSINHVERIESIAGLAGRVRNLKPSQATMLASYLLAAKPAAEHERILEYLPSFRRWSQLFLALADGLDRAKVQRDQWEPMLSRLLDQEITLSDGEAGRETLRGILLRQALTELDADRATVSAPELIDRARSLLLDQYVRQANLLGVPRPAFADATGPAAVLKAIIEHYSTRLNEAGATKEATRQLAEIPHQLQAIEYIATNRLQQTVLLERIWLQLLATHLKREAPETSADAERIIRDLRQADRAAGNSFAQLHASQTALVQMWMLWNRPK